MDITDVSSSPAVFDFPFPEAMKAVPKDSLHDFIGRAADTPGKTSSVPDIQVTLSGILEHPAGDSRIPGNMRARPVSESGISRSLTGTYRPHTGTLYGGIDRVLRAIRVHINRCEYSG